MFWINFSQTTWQFGVVKIQEYHSYQQMCLWCASSQYPKLQSFFSGYIQKENLKTKGAKIVSFEIFNSQVQVGSQKFDQKNIELPKRTGVRTQDFQGREKFNLTSHNPLRL
jgi:hypothetical protein